MKYGAFLDYLPGLIAVGAGLYLLSNNTAATIPGGGTSWFEILAHGIGAYFVARGIQLARSAWRDQRAASDLARLVELQAVAHHQRAA